MTPEARSQNGTFGRGRRTCLEMHRPKVPRCQESNVPSQRGHHYYKCKDLQKSGPGKGEWAHSKKYVIGTVHYGKVPQHKFLMCLSVRNF